jgi:hypothetical protein
MRVLILALMGCVRLAAEVEAGSPRFPRVAQKLHTIQRSKLYDRKGSNRAAALSQTTVPIAVLQLS